MQEADDFTDSFGLASESSVWPILNFATSIHAAIAGSQLSNGFLTYSAACKSHNPSLSGKNDADDVARRASHGFDCCRSSLSKEITPR